MTQEYLFTVAGTDLRDFVDRWETESRAAFPPDHPGWNAENDPNNQGEADYAASHIMACIAPRCWGALGSREELLLFAVLATCRAGYGDRPPGPWPGFSGYVEWAFEQFHEVGAREAARRLREAVGDRASDERQARDAAMRASLGMEQRDLVKEAAHDQKMAAGAMRDLRAAEALDPGGDPWEEWARSPAME
jgi:hypothetical protein